MVRVIDHVDMHVVKLVGAFLTVMGIGAAATSVLLFVPLGYVEVGVIVLFSLWLSWTLLRDGIPPYEILVSNNPTKIGLRNTIAVRWFWPSECQLMQNDDGTANLMIDNRTIQVTAKARLLLEELLSNGAT